MAENALHKCCHRLSYYFKIYWKIVNVYIKARLGYRSDFILGFIGMIAKSFLGVITLSIIFSNIPKISGWTFYDLLFFYGLYSMALVPVNTFFPNVWNLHNHIIQGTFIKFCLRPINTMFYYFSEIFEFKSLMQLAISIPIIVYSSAKIGIHWDLRTFGILISYFICSSIIIICIYIMAASLGFWLTNSLSIVNFIGQMLNFSQYPLNIYNRVFSFIFSYIFPIGLVAYYPALVILEKVSYGNLLQPVILAIIFMVLCSFVWKKGVEHYSGTGS